MVRVGGSVLVFNFLCIPNESYYAVKYNCRKLHVATRAGEITIRKTETPRLLHVDIYCLLLLWGLKL